MVKALSFKGDPKTKKRKRNPTDQVIDKLSNDNSGHGIDGNGADGYENADQDTAWVSAEQSADLAGPTLLVLVGSSLTPDSPPVTLSENDDKHESGDQRGTVSCIATDSLGTVFASRIENMIENAPSTAEPHDVRQVWIVSRVAGLKGVSFKGHHGKYLSVDRYGIASATKDAIGPEETFDCEPIATQDGSSNVNFRLESCRKTFLGVAINSKAADEKNALVVRGDFTLTDTTTDDKTAEKPTTGPDTKQQLQVTSAQDETTDTATRVIIRVQSKFKVRTQVAKATKESLSVSKSQLEADARGLKLDEAQIRMLRKARKEGRYHEAMLDVRAKGSHDKFA